MHLGQGRGQRFLITQMLINMGGIDFRDRPIRKPAQITAVAHKINVRTRIHIQNLPPGPWRPPADMQTQKAIGSGRGRRTIIVLKMF
jgi:hypothetical protein